MLSRKISKEDASRAKNLILTYDSSIKAYFRFQDLHNKFEKDEFVDWPWISFRNGPQISSLNLQSPQPSSTLSGEQLRGPGERPSHLGIDIIPNDVCPSVFAQIPALRFNGANRLQDYKFKDDLN